MKNTLNFMIPWYILRKNRLTEEKNAGSRALSPAGLMFDIFTYLLLIFWDTVLSQSTRVNLSNYCDFFQILF